MRRRQFLFGAAAVAGVTIAGVPILLAPGDRDAPPAPPAAIGADEHGRTIAEMRPPKRARPVIALHAHNDATEITDLLVPFGVLARAAVAEVAIVARHAAPIPLYPFSKFGRGNALLKVDPHATISDFDARYPEGADFVIVPAIDPRDDGFAREWIVAQHRKGATILSVCAGALTLAAAGLLDGRRATTHWAYVDELREGRPGVRLQPDRRYVAGDGIVTSTGITASIPLSVALVEAIAGRDRAAALAREIGVASWDARHRSADFALTGEHRKTFLRNWLSFWQRPRLGLALANGVEEIALALTLDAHARTALAEVGTLGAPVRSRHGLTLRPHTATARTEEMLTLTPGEAPARAIDTALDRIAARFGQPTADIVALQMEYPRRGSGN